MRAFMILCCGLLAAVVAVAADESERDKGVEGMASGESKAMEGTPDVSSAPFAYVPPQSMGAPRNRTVGAASRSARLPGPTLYSLVPEHTGQTISEQPSFFWYLDALPDDDVAVYFTLTNDREIDPIAEIQLPKVTKAGIQRVDLAQYDIKLERGIEYEWTVAVVVDPDQRANDVVTAGWVMVVDEPAGLEPTARSYAAHGLWYDAMATAPDDLRAHLLRDVGLEETIGGAPPD